MRALAILGQGHVDVRGDDRRLHVAVGGTKGERVAQAANADLVDGEMALVARRLRVGDGNERSGVFGTIHGFVDSSGSEHGPDDVIPEVLARVTGVTIVIGRGK